MLAQRSRLAGEKGAGNRASDWATTSLVGKGRADLFEQKVRKVCLLALSPVKSPGLVGNRPYTSLVHPSRPPCPLSFLLANKATDKERERESDFMFPYHARPRRMIHIHMCTPYRETGSTRRTVHRRMDESDICSRNKVPQIPTHNDKKEKQALANIFLPS